MPYTFDTSSELELALIAEANMSGARYVPLSEAPSEKRTALLPYLRQMHAVANAVPCGLTVMARMPFQPQLWLRL